MSIWRTDAHGQIGGDEGADEKGKQRNGNATRNIIGPYTRAKKRKRRRYTLKENLPETYRDTNEKMETSKNREKADGRNITAKKIRPMKYGKKR